MADFKYKPSIPPKRPFRIGDIVELIDSQGRDGCFEDNQLFAVFERDDVLALIARLQMTVTLTSGESK